MPLSYDMAGITGSGLDDCFFVGCRSDYDFGPDPRFKQFFVLHAGPEGRVRPVLGPSHWFNTLSRSPQGTLYVADGPLVHRGAGAPEGSEPKWISDELPYVVDGVFALNDTHVLAWGFDQRDDGQEIQRLYRVSRFDGRAWHPLPAPSGEISGMHGRSPDLIYAVGPKSLIARWDGAQWTQLPILWEVNTLSRVHVVSPDEIYVIGQDALLEGTRHGWSVLARSESTLTDVLENQGQLWVAGTWGGLLRLQRNTLEVVNEKLTASHLAATPNGLLVSTGRRLVELRDGKEVRALSVRAFADAIRHIPVPWDEAPRDAYDAFPPDEEP